MHIKGCLKNSFKGIVLPQDSIRIKIRSAPVEVINSKAVYLISPRSRSRRVSVCCIFMTRNEDCEGEKVDKSVPFVLLFQILLLHVLRPCHNSVKHLPLHQLHYSLARSSLHQQMDSIKVASTLNKRSSLSSALFKCSRRTTTCNYTVVDAGVE